jgi:uncharacterized protein YyaL (SSP411 family)
VVITAPCALLLRNTFSLPACLYFVGPQNEVAKWQDELRSRYLPELMTFAFTKNIANLPDALNKPVSDKSTAWLCQGTQCLPPINSLHKLRDMTQA